MPSPRPLSIKIIVVYELLSTWLPVGYLMEPAYWTPVLGMRVDGWPALAYSVFMVVFSSVIAVGLWRLSELARKSAIGLTVYGILGVLLALVNPAIRAAAAAEVYDSQLGPLTNIVIDTSVEIVVLFVEILVLYFLIKRKSAFVASQSRPSHQPSA